MNESPDIQARARRMVIHELQPARLIPNLTSGLIIGLMSVALAISFAALIFSGELSSFLGWGIGLAFLSTIVTGVMIALFSSLPGMVAVTQDAPAAILGIGAVAVLASLPADVQATERFLTVIAFCAVTTLLSALVLIGLGVFRRANLVRYLPYPVVGGFLAGTGWLLLMGGLGIMLERHLDVARLTELLDPGLWSRWLPGLLLGVLLLAVTSRLRHPLVWPGLLLGATLGFYLALFGSGGSLAQWREAGLLLGPFPSEALLRPFRAADLAQVQWAALLAQSGTAASVMIISLLSVLLNSTGLELVTNRDIDLNRELQVAGAGNFFVGLLGGMIGYQALSFTTFNHRIGTGSRVGALVATSVVVLALVLGTSFLGLVPKMVIGGLLVFLGLGFLVEWVYSAYFRLSKLDYAIVLLILSVIAAWGFLEGVALGLGVALALFVLAYSRTEVVRHALDGVSYRSRVTRSPQAQRRLQQNADKLLILKLQGFLFFGTAHSLLERVTAHISRSPQLEYVIFDFKRVSGVDATSALAFAKLIHLAQAKDFFVVFAQLSPALSRQFDRAGLRASPLVRSFADLDHAVEWCEDRVLQASDADLAASGHRPLRALLADADLYPRLLAYLERLELVPGEYLLRQGEQADSLWFIETGTLSAHLETAGEDPTRLETMQGGNTVGEIGFYSGGVRSASVVADSPCTVYRLSTHSLEQMTRSEPDLAASLHRLIVRVLGERVVHLMRVVGAMEQG